MPKNDHTPLFDLIASDRDNNVPDGPPCKQCTRCKQLIPRDQYVKDSRRKDGLYPHCPECRRRNAVRSYRNRKRRLATDVEYREKSRRKQREWAARNPDKVKELNARFRLIYSDEQRKNQALRWNHGITIDDYKVMFDAQGGVCAICGREETNLLSRKTGRIRQLAVDHCHETGKIRGLLCSNCNMGIGYFRDDPEIMRKAITYLKAYGR